jgi:antitoxin component of RelBE/YafQ-DinJ toxin-antitoxin module
MGMRTILKISSAIVLAGAVATPAFAVGIGDLAKTVLGNGSILKKGQEKCGASLAITSQESLAMTFARAAAERALPISQFTALDQASQTSAEQAAQSPTFCPQTAKKKSGLMNAMKKAGKAILKARILGQ